MNFYKNSFNLFNIIRKTNRLAVSPIVRNINYETTAMPSLEEEGEDSKKKTRHWLTYNEKIFPPQSPGEERRPAYVCHVKENIKWPPKKMWYVACFVRGMTIDEAVRQLKYIYKKGAGYAIDTLLEAQQMAVDNHYVEFKTESMVGKGHVIKGLRRHARGRMGMVEYKYCHYFVRLEEGNPPENYYNVPSQDKETLLQKWIQQMRNRRVINSL